MSSKQFVEFRGNGFWAYDVVLGVFLKHLIDAATSRLDPIPDAWLSDAVASWRVVAAISDYGLSLDGTWSPQQLDTFTELADEACNALSWRDEIPAEEIETWEMVEGVRCFARGLPAVKTASAIRLGRAIIQLIDGTLPEAPPGTSWFFATDENPRTIQMRDE